ncbi:hypothetical protein EON81_28425 [bacterium]|nr:MAG: hypothetical protein EON81_28425 [bacterium]
MSDSRLFQDRTIRTTSAETGRDDGSRSILQPLTQADIDDVLSNPGMTIDEKHAWLTAYAGQAAEQSDADRGGEFEPLEMQIRDAFSMLADGGHAYGAADSVDVDPERPIHAPLVDEDGHTRT